MFAKYVQHLADRAADRRPATSRRTDPAGTDDGEDWPARLRALLLPEPQAADPAGLAGEAALLAALAIWGIWFAGCDWRDGEAGTSFLHNADLAFHEFGHLLFRPFGEWLMYLGGSLFQCLVPLLLGAVFLLRERKPFGGAVCLWWFGQNLVDVAPYVGDARALALPLIGEWNEEMVEVRPLRHDWHNILDAVGLLNWDARLAALAHWGGVLAMLAAIGWGGTLLWRSWQASRR
ncbi:zinc ribbon domain-containing protein [Chitinimonas koreensis]|nr:zinc ribbon domain-containing protein [Chitinimonas koreensis]